MGKEGCFYSSNKTSGSTSGFTNYDDWLQKDKFDFYCPGGDQVSSADSFKKMAKCQNECAKDEMINEEYKDNNTPNPTLAGAHAHLTTHIQNNQGFYREWVDSSDFEDCRPSGTDCVLSRLDKIKNEINSNFGKFQTNIDSIKSKMDLMKNKIQQLKDIKNEKCPNKECKCLKNFEWDKDEQACVCPPPMEIDEDGTCSYPIIEERYDVESVLILGGSQDRWENKFDSLLFCPNSDILQDTRDVVDNQILTPPHSMRFMHAA